MTDTGCGYFQGVRWNVRCFRKHRLSYSAVKSTGTFKTLWKHCLTKKSTTKQTIDYFVRMWDENCPVNIYNHQNDCPSEWIQLQTINNKQISPRSSRTYNDNNTASTLDKIQNIAHRLFHVTQNVPIHKDPNQVVCSFVRFHKISKKNWKMYIIPYLL